MEEDKLKDVPPDDRGIHIITLVNDFTKRINEIGWQEVKSIDIVIVKSSNYTETFHVGDFLSTTYGFIKHMKDSRDEFYAFVTDYQLESLIVEQLRKKK